MFVPLNRQLSQILVKICVEQRCSPPNVDDTLAVHGDCLPFAVLFMFSLRVRVSAVSLKSFLTVDSCIYRRLH